MNSQNLAFFSMNLDGKFSDSDKMIALNQCGDLDDDALSSFYTINSKFKSPWMGVLFHWLLGIFGAGRFYKGDIGLGVLYIVCFVVGCVLLAIGAVISDEDGDDSLLIIAVIFCVIYYIVLLVDFFLIYKGIQKDNFAKFQNFLLFSKHRKG